MALSSFPAHTGFNFTPTLHKDIYDNINPAITKSLSQPSKVVLVTGAGRGIGRAIALQYAYASVASLYLMSRTITELDSLAKEIHAINSAIRVHIFTVDVTSEESIRNVAAHVTEQEGRLDILVNNAGWSSPWVPLTETVPSEWWKNFDINVKGVYLLTHAFLPLLQKTAKDNSTQVHIINIGSIGAWFDSEMSTGYNLTKLAVQRLSEVVNVAYSSSGVICLGLHPGAILTTLAKDVAEGYNSGWADTVDLAGGFTVWLTTPGKEWLGGRYVAATWDVEELEGKKGEIVERDLLKIRMTV